MDLFEQISIIPERSVVNIQLCLPAKYGALEGGCDIRIPDCWAILAAGHRNGCGSAEADRRVWKRAFHIVHSNLSASGIYGAGEHNQVVTL